MEKKPSSFPRETKLPDRGLSEVCFFSFFLSLPPEHAGDVDSAPPRELRLPLPGAANAAAHLHPEVKTLHHTGGASLPHFLLLLLLLKLKITKHLQDQCHVIQPREESGRFRRGFKGF